MCKVKSTARELYLPDDGLASPANFIVLMAEHESDDDEPSGPDWDLLSAELGADALAALQAHLADGAPPAPRDASAGSLGAAGSL